MGAFDKFDIQSLLQALATQEHACFKAILWLTRDSIFEVTLTQCKLIASFTPQSFYSQIVKYEKVTGHIFSEYKWVNKIHYITYDIIQEYRWKNKFSCHACIILLKPNKTVAKTAPYMTTTCRGLFLLPKISILLVEKRPLPWLLSVEVRTPQASYLRNFKNDTPKCPLFVAIRWGALCELKWNIDEIIGNR